MTSIASKTLLAICVACAASVVVGCRPDPAPPSAPPLAAAADARPGPSVRRVALEVKDEDQRGFNAGRGGQGGMLSQLIYDEPRDRFFVPGRHAIARDGTVTRDPEPMVGPPGAATRPFDELREALGLCRWRQGETVCDDGLFGIVAVWYGPDTTVVLSRRPGGRQNGESWAFPDELLVAALDPQTLEVVGGAHLEVPWVGANEREQRPGSMQRIFGRFVRDGTLIVDAGLGPLSNRGGHRLSFGGGRIGRVRVDARGEKTVLDRNAWRVKAADFGLEDAAAAREFFGWEAGKAGAARSPDGVYALEQFYGAKGRQYFIASFDGDAQLRWRREMRSPVSDWVVDDRGWIYVSTVERGARDHGKVVRPNLEIIAVTPSGEMAWRWSPRPNPSADYVTRAMMGTLLLAKNDLCFFFDEGLQAGAQDPRPPPELVCLSPLHERAVE